VLLAVERGLVAEVRRRLLEEMEAAGFVGAATPDVGASSTIAFVVASMPSS
jgi:hypothetical protein